MSKIARLFVIDPLPLGDAGHHQHFIAGTVNDAGRLGFDPIFLVGRSRNGIASPDRRFHEIFRHYLYKPLSNDPENGPLIDLSQGSDAFCQDLAILRTMSPRQDDLIFLPSASARTLAGLAKWRIATNFPSPLAALFHHVVPPSLDLTPNSLGHRIFRIAGELLQETKSIGPYFIAATNSQLAKNLTAALEIATNVVPQPHWYDLVSPSAEAVYQPRNSNFVPVASVGVLRRAKGGHLLPEVAKLLRQSGCPARLVVQASAGERQLIEQLSEMEIRGELDLVRNELPESQFIRLIRDAALILLPYDPIRYRTRISGPFSFAVAWQRPCVVPARTWMAEQIETARAAGLMYAGYDAQVIADAVNTAISDLPNLKQTATKYAAAWRADNGTALLKRLTDWAAEARSVTR